MSLSATSRLPVEIWEKIVRMVVTGMQVLNPDPYDVPHAKLLATHVYRRPYDQYKDYMAQILQLRLVCKAWDQFSNPFIDLVVSLDQLYSIKDDQIESIKKLSQTIRIVAFSLSPLCRCRFGASCKVCRKLYFSGAHSADYMHKVVSTKILDGVYEEDVCTLIESPEPFPKLEAMTLHCDMWFLWPTSEIAIKRLSNLVFLSIRTKKDGPFTTNKMPLDFPQLRSLEFFAEGQHYARIENWELPLLTTLIIELANCDLDGLVEVISDTAPNLKFLGLPDEGEFDAEEASQIWSLFPHLVALACPVDFFLAHLPPSTHPLQSFLGMEELSDFNGAVLWISEFERVLSNEPFATHEEDRSSLWQYSDRLGGGLELGDLGVRYEDRYGISFVEACDKFGGATPIASVKSSIDSVMVALGVRPIYGEVQLLSPAEDSQGE